ncbi:hypothetical protein DYB32_010526 [Aphanomyces invadans]|uniref:No apical meristem-associated C-terminal domain-containing protein n=1 Tax=Aphanomyces invadans TaxID=157072 RepID=A0A418AFQ6_9STRA|nr:hypothetical protein DYB32_010526 [Aphanomyces invadans]
MTTLRTADSLYIHWRDTINKQVASFASALKLSKSVVRSGYNNEQYMADAQEYFKAQRWNKRQAAFKLMHCWEVLKDQPKWLRLTNAEVAEQAASPAELTKLLPTEAKTEHRRPADALRVGRPVHGRVFRRVAGALRAGLPVGM